jgi:cell shape-determining protein MreD
MDGWIWSSADYGWLAFIVLDGLGALAANSTGRAFASSWSSRLLIVPAMIVLAAAVHFLHFALFQEDLTSLYYYLVSLVIMLIAAFLGYQFRRVKQMSTQYSWAFESAGLAWRAK